MDEQLSKMLLKAVDKRECRVYLVKLGCKKSSLISFLQILTIFLPSQFFQGAFSDETIIKLEPLIVAFACNSKIVPTV